MKPSRTILNGVVSALLVITLPWVPGCRESSPLGPSARQVAARASAATAAATTDFTGFINFCHAGEFSYFNAAGRTVHFGVSNENMWVTGNALIDGIEHNTGIALIDPHGLVVNLDNSLKPSAVNGSWEIKQQFRIPDGTTSGVAHGTGDLHGLTMKFTTEGIVGSPSDCNPELGKAAVHGVILSPAG